MRETLKTQKLDRMNDGAVNRISKMVRKLYAMFSGERRGSEDRECRKGGSAGLGQ